MRDIVILVSLLDLEERWGGKFFLGIVEDLVQGEFNMFSSFASCQTYRHMALLNASLKIEMTVQEYICIWDHLKDSEQSSPPSHHP